MKKAIKGQRGYMHARKIKLGIGTLAGFLMMILIYFIGYLIFNTGKNYVTILAVLVILPTAKIFVQYLMIPWSCKVSDDEYNKAEESAAPLKVYFDLLITAQEKCFAINFLLIDKDENIIAYTADAKAEPEKFEKGVTNFLNYYDFNAKVKLFKDSSQFNKRAKQLAERNHELTNEQNEHIELVFEKISIMSI